MGKFGIKYAAAQPTKDHRSDPVPWKMFHKKQENHTFINNEVDEIHIIESKTVRAINHESPEILKSYYNNRDLYQVENMSLDETKETIEWGKRALEYESSYLSKKLYKMIYIHDNEVKNIPEYNLLHDIINPPKRAKNINSHYSLIIHGCLNTRKGRAKFKPSKFY